MRVLDKQKPYGEIFHAENSDGRRYEQDGVFFASDGKEWTAPEVVGTPEPGSAAFKAAVDAAVAAELAKQKPGKLDKNLNG